MQERFLGWYRPALTGLGDALAGARLSAALPVTLSDDQGDLPPVPAAFALAGVLDVAALAPGAVIRRQPAPGATDAEATMLPFVELGARDLPWRYTPAKHSAGTGLRPWLVLVVGRPGAEVELLAGDRVRLHGEELFGRHPLGQSPAWAHVHQTPGRDVARILCPRPLEPATDYLAVLVPAWRPGRQGEPALVDAWSATTPDVELACFDRWSFRTVDAYDDFLSIARRLDPLTAGEQAALRAAGFGRARVGAGLGQPDVLEAGGALAAIPESGEPAVVGPLPGPVVAATATLAAELPPQGERWVLALPRYDREWLAPPPPGGAGWDWPPTPGTPVPAGWRTQLRQDPRHRGAAGLGAWAAIAWQARIAKGATRQAGALAAAAQRVRNLAAGLAAARSLWLRRVPPPEAGGAARLAVLAPLLGRMPAQGGGTALAALAGRTPWLVPALLSSAARRVLRPRSALARAAAPGATALPALLTAAATCPPPQQLGDDDARLADAMAATSPEQAWAQLREREGELVQDLTSAGVDEGEAVALRRGLDQLGADALVRVGLGRPPENTCSEPDLDALGASVAAGIDPTVARPVVVDRVVGTITGLREPVLAPPELAPELDIPLWSFLRERAPDWLLPGGGEVPADRVLALSTNPSFVEAFLVGANHQTLGELRWRNVPVTTSWTPLRRFWERIDAAGAGVSTDIQPLATLAGAPIWSDPSELGDPAHANPAGGAQLVVLLHTALFRRYPGTVVYLVPNPGGEATWGQVPEVDQPGTTRVIPILSGTLTPELVFFGFPVPPTAAATHWLVLEEPPPGYRFRHRSDVFGHPVPDPVGVDGASFAATLLCPPARAFFGNLL